MVVVLGSGVVVVVVFRFCELTLIVRTVFGFGLDWIGSERTPIVAIRSRRAVVQSRCVLSERRTDALVCQILAESRTRWEAAFTVTVSYS